MNGENQLLGVPWEKFSKWVHSVGVVTFDLEWGQALEIIYPGDADLSSIEKANMCYLAFPDSTFSPTQDVTYHFRMRKTWPKLIPSHCTLLEDSLTSIPLDPSYLYGFVHFRQHKDPTIKRGYYQKSVVLLTSLPFFSLWSLVTSKIAQGFFDLGETAIEAACHDFDQWPNPTPGLFLTLPIMGTVVQCRIPLRGDIPFSTAANFICQNDLQASTPSILLPSLFEIDPYKCLSNFVYHLQLLWELILIEEPLLVMASTPTRSSAVVQALVSLIMPLRLQSDFRPYFTIHDSEFREYSAKTRNLPCAILGVTNPFFTKVLQHWPHVLKLGEDATNEENEKQAEKTKNRDKRGIDLKSGLYTQYKPFLAHDKSFSKKLLKTGRPDEVNSAVIRRYFLELTQSFMIPLERHLSSLMPLRKNMSPFKSIPYPRPFVLDDFLSGLDAAGPSLTCAVKGDWAGLYRRFACTRTFASWLAQRNMEITKQIRLVYIDEICQADLNESLLSSHHHAEIVDLVLRMRLIASQIPTGSDRRAFLIRQISHVRACLSGYYAIDSSSDNKMKAIGEMQPLVLPRSGQRLNPALLYPVNNVGSQQKVNANAAKSYKESIFDSEKDLKKELPKTNYRECSPIRIKPTAISAELNVYHALTPEELDAKVEYELDDVDECWLNAILKERKLRIDPEVFAHVIDRLEKESTFQPKKLLNPHPNNTEEACCICGLEEDEDLNRIIYCDLCNIAVHQECYGVPFIPEGSWFCRRCKLSPSAPVTCAVCPNQDGAFKTTSDQRWVHVICTIWLNELHFLNTVFLEPVEGVDKCLEIRSRLCCMLCKKKYGACIQCSQRSCVRAFHVTCAQSAKMYMKVDTAEDSDASEMMDVQRFAYCHMHDPTDTETDVAVKRRKMEEACKLARKVLKQKKNYDFPVSIPKISRARVDNIARRFHCSQYIKEVFEYWIMKRKQRFGVPLISRLQEEVELRNMEQGTSILEIPEVDQLRQDYSRRRNDLEKQRMLWELVKKREILKKDHVSTTKIAFDRLCTPSEMLFSQLLDELEQQDKQKVFLEPVENKISGYRMIVSKPMDIQSMKSKLNAKKYSTITEIRKDLELMCSNCEKFNSHYHQDFYLQYGKKYLKKCIAIVEKFQARYQFINSMTQDDYEKFGILLSKMSFYETDLSSERVKENAPIGIHIDNSPHLKGNIFLQTPPKTIPHFSFVDNKRHQNDLLIPPIKRRKIHEDSGLRQTSLKQFLNPPRTSPTQTPAAIESRRSRQNPKQPFTDYRQNSIQSPLAADVASSTEYSTEDDDKGTRRTGREGLRKDGRSRRHRTTTVQQSQTPDSELIHNDIVYITQSGAQSMNAPAIGRVLDPRFAELDETLSTEVVNKVRRRNGNNDALFVVHFGDRNPPTCAAYPISNLRLVDFDITPSPRNKQFKMAVEFRNQMRSNSTQTK
ncbi:unnamed protein product, partial [Mesorhabditis belari]|uniref:Uncharacterized protein n=1 Tax=Mesorhabditis belari TaxID=2138241 RepID=A0AAF3FI99_9BILA